MEYSLMLHKIEGDSGQEELTDVKDVINLVVNHLFQVKDWRVHEWVWDFQTDKDRQQEVIKKTEEFFISSCVASGDLGGLPDKSFGIFFRLSRWMVWVVLFVFKRKTTIQYRLMDHGYGSFVHLHCHVSRPCPDGGVTTQDPVLLDVGGKEVTSTED